MDWKQILDSWDEQQTGYLPRREERFAVMVSTLGDLLGEEFVVLDLGCGPGSLGARIARAYPRARVVAVDADPVLLRIGRGAHPDLAGRLTFLDADFRDRRWSDRLPVQRVDAAVSTTALHWLEPGVLLRLYRQLGGLIRPGGVFLNGDDMPYDPGQRALARLAGAAEARAAHEAFEERGVADWERWWAQIGECRELADVVTERRQRQERSTRVHGERDGDRLTSYATHLLGLSEGGFGEAGTIWQRFQDRVLLGVRDAGEAP